MQNTPPSGTPPDAPGGNTTSSNVTHLGATTLAETTVTDGQTYSSITGGENALLVTGGDITINGVTVTKSGDESSENSDFYGTNAAVLATGGSIILNGGSITTDGAHANALFAYGEGSVNAKNLTIKTSGNNSGGVMVTGGGTLLATDVTVSTSGNSSAAIRSDRGGGTMTIDGGSYSTSGVGSPAIYSTANITASNAELISTASEGIVVEGFNSVALYESTLTDTNNTLNGNSETYKNIFIYQSMSGDAEEGTGSFYSKGSTITTNQGDTFFVTNTKASINLESNRIVNNDMNGAFLRAQAGKWGSAGSNGGQVELVLANQVVEGDLVLDNLSTLYFTLSNTSYYMGIINGANSAQNVSVTLDDTSQIVLAGDSYVSALTNTDTTNQNIYSNGYKLYVAGEEVAINGSAAPTAPEVTTDSEPEQTDGAATDKSSSATTCKETFFTDCSGNVKLPILVGGIAILVIILAIVAFVLHGKKKKGPKAPKNPDAPMGGPSMVPPAPEGERPDFSAFDDGPVAQPQTPQTPTPPQEQNSVGQNLEGFPKQ